MVRRDQKGFSLIELLIVVAIILIIAAIAVPNLIRGKMSANHASAVQSLRTISTGQSMYHNTYQAYAPDLVSLGTGTPGGVCPVTGPGPANACLVDAVVTGGATTGKSGYLLDTSGIPDLSGTLTTYLSRAGPIVYNRTGLQAYCVTDDGVIRFNPTNTASGLPTVAYAGCLALPAYSPLAQ
jgi:prepilin-type N-terminal cleavage/methylation domain-containing protein